MRTQCESYLPSINLEVDNSEVTQKLQEFHITLATLANVECNVCLERFHQLKLMYQVHVVAAVVTLRR